MRLVFFDLETGGLELHHPIIQIAAVATTPDGDELSSFEAKLQFDIAQADAESLTKNSYSAEAWASRAVPPSVALSSFTQFLRPFTDIPMVSRRNGRPYRVAQLIGHNAAEFDSPRLQHAFKSNDIFLNASWSVLDTVQRARFFFHEHPELPRPASYSLGDLCAALDVPLVDAHDALADVRATAGIYRAMRNHGK